MEFIKLTRPVVIPSENFLGVSKAFFKDFYKVFPVILGVDIPQDATISNQPKRYFQDSSIQDVKMKGTHGCKQPKQARIDDFLKPSRKRAPKVCSNNFTITKDKLLIQ